MARSTAAEIFEHYYQALVSSLPMRDVSFIDKLQKHKLLPGHIKAIVSSLNISREKASHFLDNVIKPELTSKIHTCFDELLIVMMESDYDNMKELAWEVRSQLHTNNRGTIQGMYVCVWVLL